jgi:hypothetical protein
MIKAKELWTDLCEKYDYRFFTGVPFEDVAKLYRDMNADIMHYVPASNEHIAYSLASGAWISGFKSGVLLEPHKINRLDLDIPVLLMTIVKETPLIKGLYSNTELSKVIAYIEKNGKSGVLLLT